MQQYDIALKTLLQASSDSILRQLAGLAVNHCGSSTFNVAHSCTGVHRPDFIDS